MGRRAGVGDWRALWKRLRRLLRFEIAIRIFSSVSVALEGAICKFEGALAYRKHLRLGQKVRAWDKSMDVASVDGNEIFSATSAFRRIVSLSTS